MMLAAHDFANLFPLIEGPAFVELVEDIRQHGLRDAIVLLDRQILDGRNRFNALVELAESGELLGDGWGHRAGEPLDPALLDPPQSWFAAFNQAIHGDPLQWVLSKNLQRRHLTESQRAMVAADIATMRQGERTDLSPIGERSSISQSEAAQMAHAAKRSVERAVSVKERGVPELSQAVRDGNLAVSAAEKIARLPEPEQPAALARALPNGHRAIMGSRVEPDDSLDYFPTPPWAVRALIEHVLPLLGLRPEPGNMTPLADNSAWEPACGEGHIAEVLAEYFGTVSASDVFDYGYGSVHDFLVDDRAKRFDWIITNPPFGEAAEAFTLKALRLAQYGVAMFVRLQWLETVGRYEAIFRDQPPTVVAFFAERVPLCKGRWNPEGDTATAYVWLVWDKYEARQPPFWIPPGRREALTRPDDAVRFTTQPVTRRAAAAAADGAAGVDPDCIRATDDLAIGAAAGAAVLRGSALSGAASCDAAGAEDADPPASPAVVAGGAVSFAPIAGACCARDGDGLDIPNFLKRCRDDSAAQWTAKACA